MIGDPPPGFRDELIAALDVLAPQIDGLGDLNISSVSSAAKEIISGTLSDKIRRQALIEQVIAAMDGVVTAWNKLKDDGYPATPLVVASGAVFDELSAETKAIETAMALFEGASVKLDTAHAVHRPQPVPTA